MGQGERRNDGGQMERLLGELERRCITETACSSKGEKKKDNEWDEMS